MGGAGAQRELGVQILTSLRHYVDKGLARLNLVAGVRNDVYLYYQRVIKELGLLKKQNGHVSILFADNKLEYFKKLKAPDQRAILRHVRVLLEQVRQQG